APVRAESVLFVGAAPDRPRPLGADQAVLGVDATGGLHLLWHGRRLAIRDPDLVLAAFAWPKQAAVPLATGLLNAIPAGADLGRLHPIGHSGRSALAGVRVGEVFVVENQRGDRQFGVVSPAGLADITQVQAAVLLADGANGLAGTAKPISQAEYAAGPHAPALVPTGPAAPPAEIPDLARSPEQQGVCARFPVGGSAPEVVATQTSPRAGYEVRARAGVDWVAVPPGRGAVVEAAPGGAQAIVTDLGIRYPLPSGQVLALLGYPADQVRPVRLPSALVALLPLGRPLDPVAAAVPSTG
ncbi:MAG TPA: type VII secretion protein EccB, partial [Micromonosporaceae bacterium]